MTGIVASRSFAGWWHGATYPPPAPWRYTFELFTSGDTADEWGLAAAVYIAQYRRRHSRGPTLLELFTHLLPDTEGIPSPLPDAWNTSERRLAVSDFRDHAALEWRRRGYIRFDKQVSHSLRVGPEFRARSRRLRVSSRLQQSGLTEEKATFLIEEGGFTLEELAWAIESVNHGDLGRLAEETKQAAWEATLSVEEVLVRLDIRPAMLRRLSDAGYLHAFQTPTEVRYPEWQFTDKAGRRVVPGIDIVVSSFPKGWTLASIVGFMATPQADLKMNGVRLTPVDWLLREGDPKQVAMILDSIPWI